MSHQTPRRTLRVPERAAEPLARLLATLEARGHAVMRGPSREALAEAGATLVAGPAADGACRMPAPHGGARVLVLSHVGAHPDARAPRLRALWALEEEARASGLPVLVIRLGPLVGPRSPLWWMFASRPRLPRGGRHVLCPVCEEDVVEALDRALTDRVAWNGWYEACGAEPMSMAELASLAGAAGVPPTADPAWEPDLELLLEQRLAEPGPWLDHFGLAPAPLARRAAEWAA